MQLILDRIRDLEAHNRELTTRLSLRESVPPSPTPRKDNDLPKVAQPDLFRGDMDKLNAFLTQVTTVFESQPSRYSEETSKVAYVASYLRDGASEWYQVLRRDTHKDEEKTKILSSYSEFQRALRESFGDPDELATAERELENLRQSDFETCAEYARAFKRISPILELGQNALRLAFYRGLDERLKAEFARLPRIGQVNALIAKAIELDNALSAYEKEKSDGRLLRKAQDLIKSGGVTDTRGRATSQTSNSNSHPRSARANNTNISRNKQAPEAAQVTTSVHATNPPVQLLSQAERDKRKNESLCYGCGKPGHIRRDCRTNPLQPRVPEIKVSMTEGDSKN